MKKSAYDEAFETERRQQYPLVDLWEDQLGFALEPERLEGAARVLACPVKKNPPNWQHGRLVYAIARRLIQDRKELTKTFTMFDIGTAKGFSALCALWALLDSGQRGRVHSVDVIDPKARISRNTVAEVDGLKTLAETLAPWPEAIHIDFRHATSANWLMLNRTRINFAFVDGKHNYPAVKKDCEMLMPFQVAGDVIMFDDIHIGGVFSAVEEMTKVNHYKMQVVSLMPTRGYAIATKVK